MKVRRTALKSIGAALLVNSALLSFGWAIVDGQKPKQLRPGNRTPKAMAQNSPELVIQNTHSDDVTSIAFSPDGRLLATGSWDATVMVRDVRSGRLLRILGKHPGGVTSVSFSLDSEVLASGGRDNTVKVWSVRSGRLLRNIPNVGVVAFSPKRDLIACAAINGRKIDYGDYAIRLINAQTGKLVRLLKGHKDQISSLVFSPDGQIIVSASGPLNGDNSYSGEYGGADSSIRLWNTQTGELISTKELRKTNEYLTSVLSLAFHPDGKLFASTSFTPNASTSGEDAGSIDIDLWDAKTGQLINHLDSTHGSVAFSRDGRVLASTGGGLKLWDLKSGSLIRTIENSENLPMPEDSVVSFSADGKTIAATVPFGISIWDTNDGHVVQRHVWNIFSTISGTFGADGETFVLSGRKGSATVWDVSSGSRVRKLETGEVFALSSDNKTLASVREDKVTIELRDAQSGKLIRNLTGPSEQITSINFRYDGKLLVACDKRQGAPRADGGNELTIRSIKIWDVEAGKLIRSFKEKTEDYMFEDDRQVAFSPDGKIVASWSDTSSGPVNLWDAETGKLKQPIPAEFCHSVAFSPDVKMIAVGGGISGGSGFGGPPPGVLTLWDVTNEKPLWIKDYDFDEPETRALTFSPDGRFLAVGDITGAMRLFEPRSGKLIRRLDAQGVPIRSMTFDRKGKTLISVGADSATKFWSVDTGEQLASLIEFGNANWLVVAPDGLFDGVADALRQVSWRSNTGEVVSFDSFFNDFYYPNLLAEILEGNRPRARVDIATLLQLPSLRTMLSQGFAQVQKRPGKSILCFNEKPTAAPQLFKDAQPLAFDVSDLICDDVDTTCRCHKELAGDAQVEFAGSSEMKAAVPKLDYEGEKSEARGSTLHVQTVGVGNYNMSASGFRPLPSSVLGAKEINRFFVEQQTNSNKHYQNIRIWDGLYEEAATLQNIRRRFAEIAGQVKEDDVVFLFFSGHGTVPAGQEMFYFAPIDMRGPNPSDQRESGLNTAMLAEAIREMPARRVVLIIDACQSGGAIESLEKIAEVKAKVQRRRAKMALGQTVEIDRRVGIYIIAAATPLQEAVQPKKGNGALVATLLEALGENGQTNADNVWMRELIKYIQNRLPEVSEEIGQRHTPMTVASGVDFAIASSKRN
jgi:WD40 repeat protein